MRKTFVASFPRLGSSLWPEPVDPKIVEDLSRKFADFRRASTEGGIAVEEFDFFGATRRTLRQFVAACVDLDSLVRDFLLPNPDAA